MPDLNPTRIYVDADACPVKDEIYRVALRHGLPISVVAGNFIRVPQDPSIERIAAGSGMDAADDWIAERAGKGDIVITSDIPLASRCVKAGADVLAPNGKPFTEQSIGMTLAVRNLMTDLRSAGEIAQKSFLDAGLAVAKGVGAGLDLLQHGRREEVPGGERSAADEIERVVEDVDQVGDGDAE